VEYKKRFFSSEEEALEAYRKYEEVFEKAQRAHAKGKQLDADITVKNYLIYWFEHIFSGRIENTTKALGVVALYSWLLPQMEKDIKLRMVTAQYLEEILERVAKITDSAGNKCREFLNMAFKEAVEQGYLKNNPVSGVKAYSRKKPRITILTKDKLKEFLSAAYNNKWYFEILLALFCGLRKGEIMGLKSGDFDIEQGTVCISRQITSDPVFIPGESKPESYGVIERPPKTENSYRTLKVPDIIIEELKKRLVLLDIQKEKLGESYIDNDYISCQENGIPHSLSAFNSALSRICSKNGIPHITVHGLRHMYATILMEQGVPLVKISALLGHSSVNTTFEYYIEVMNENEEIMDFLNNCFIPGGK